MPQLRIVKRSGEEAIIDAEALKAAALKNATAGHSVMEAITNSGVEDIAAICGGACACATCHVYVAEEYGELAGAASESERELLDFSDNARPQSRLSCQIIITEALAGLRVEVAPEED